MNDFLTRLAQLSRGEAAVVAPRLPSLFAPMDVSAEAGPETLQTTFQQQNKTAATQANSQHSTTVTSGINQPQQNSSDQGLAEPHANSDSISSDSASRETKQTAETAAQAVTPNFNTRLNITAPLLNNPSPQQSTHRLTATTRADRLQTINPTRVDIAFDEGEAVESIEPPGTVMPPSSLPLVQGYKTTQATPQQIMAELPATTEPAKQQTKQPASVHINIGRVEVRAQTAVPAPAPRPAQPKPQGLSLDDYLKRGGGQS